MEQNLNPGLALIGLSGTGPRGFGDCDIRFSKLMCHLMTHDALQEWEGQRVSRMKEYESKRTKN